MSGALVPFRSSGAAADQTAPTRLVQIGPITLRLTQDPAASKSLPTPTGNTAQPDWLIDDNTDAEGVQWPTATQTLNATNTPVPISTGTGSSHARPGQPHLTHVGLVVWQSGLVLADLLLRRPPFGPWGRHVHVLDLGSGTGIVGLTLSLAGARVTMTDLPHVLPLTRINLANNIPSSSDVIVTEYRWGDDTQTLLQQVCGHPDVITAADVLYDVTQHEPLLYSLQGLVAPHTEVFISYRCRSVKEEAFKDMAEAVGFAVEIAPDSLLAEEYQGGAYRVIRLVRRDPVMAAGGVVQPGIHEEPATIVSVGGTGIDDDEGQGEHDELEHKPCKHQ